MDRDTARHNELLADLDRPREWSEGTRHPRDTERILDEIADARIAIAQSAPIGNVDEPSTYLNIISDEYIQREIGKRISQAVRRGAINIDDIDLIVNSEERFLIQELHDLGIVGDDYSGNLQ
jgi:hypothetical protein